MIALHLIEWKLNIAGIVGTLSITRVELPIHPKTMAILHLPVYAVTLEENLKIIILLLNSLMMEMMKLSRIW
jgi:hypothetical protein